MNERGPRTMDVTLKANEGSTTWIEVFMVFLLYFYRTKWSSTAEQLHVQVADRKSTKVKSYIYKSF